MGPNPTTTQNEEVEFFFPPGWKLGLCSLQLRVMAAVVPEGMGSPCAQGWLAFSPAEPGTAPCVKVLKWLPGALQPSGLLLAG